MRFLPTLFITSVLDSELWNSLVGVMGVLGQEMETVGTGDVVPPFHPFPMKQGFFVHLLTARVGNPVAGRGPVCLDSASFGDNTPALQPLCLSPLPPFCGARAQSLLTWP